MVSLLSFIWLWRDTGHPERIAALSTGAFWFFLPSMPLFLLLPLMLRAGIGFWGSLETACLVTIALYAFMAWLGPRLGLLL